MMDHAGTDMIKRGCAGPARGKPPVEWIVSEKPVAYPDALDFMARRTDGIHAGQAGEAVWLLEHPPLYTGGTSAKPSGLTCPVFPVYETGRGGEYTYHGPGQRVAYVMLNLRKRQQNPDIKKYIFDLEEWIIRTLASFGIAGERRAGRVGVWVATPAGEEKVAAIGVRIRRWVTMHGISLNVGPDLSHYAGIVPCGLAGYGVTSLEKLLGRSVGMAEADAALKAAWDGAFGVGENTLESDRKALIRKA